MKNYDAIIIGFGWGGKTLAVEMASHNWKVALVERSEKMYGGTCVNIGCLPSKTLIHLANNIRFMNLNTFGEKQEQYAAAVTHKNALTEALRKQNYDRLAHEPNITLYTGEGSFVSRNEIQVKKQDATQTITSQRIIIDTGSQPAIPPIEGLRESAYMYTSNTIMELANLPARLVVIGSGFVGLEFASMYASYGCEVVVLDSEAEFLPKEDRDVAQSIRQSLEKRGIDFKMNVQVTSLQDMEEGALVSFRDKSKNLNMEIRGNAVLVAAGRAPDTQGLNLDVAGIQTDPAGAVVVDETLRTNVANIWAIGDVKGGPQFTYVSHDDYRILHEVFFGNKSRTTANRGPIPHVLFISPAFAQVGVSEHEATAQGYTVKTKIIPASSIPRSKVLGQNEGMLKAIVDTKTNQILGCAFFCDQAGEIINTVSAAMKTGQPYTFLRDMVFTHPSMSEGLNNLFDF